MQNIRFNNTTGATCLTNEGSTKFKNCKVYKLTDEDKAAIESSEAWKWVMDDDIDENTPATTGKIVAIPLVVSVPTLVTAAQFKCALGLVRFNAIESVLAAMPDADEQFEYTQYWLNTTEFKIDHPMILGMQEALGWTDAERNQLFVDASQK